jgi:hypothetical protein
MAGGKLDFLAFYLGYFLQFLQAILHYGATSNWQAHCKVLMNIKISLLHSISVCYVYNEMFVRHMKGVRTDGEYSTSSGSIIIVKKRTSSV